MKDVQPGDVWVMMVGGDKREAKIIGPADAPGWWRCRDIATGVEFSARQGWLVELLSSGDD